MLFNDEIYLKKLGIKSISLLSESTFNPVICIQYEDQHLEKLMLKKEFRYCYDNNIRLYRIKYTDNIKESFQDILDFIKNNYINEI